ncbi:MAG: hypothetical protein MJZ33_09030 [Paludibacteraceae bacterium]|nr:hypothetical protein [Paludibacteraceae bacterium]
MNKKKKKLIRTIIICVAVGVLGILYMTIGPFKGRAPLAADEILSPSVVVPYILIVIFIFVRSYFNDDDE